MRLMRADPLAPCAGKLQATHRFITPAAIGPAAGPAVVIGGLTPLLVEAVDRGSIRRACAPAAMVIRARPCLRPVGGELPGIFRIGHRLDEGPPGTCRLILRSGGPASTRQIV